MKKDTPTLGKVIEIDEARIRDHLGELVRGSAEDTLNALLDAEADQFYATRRAMSVRRHGETRGRDEGRRGETEGAEVAPADLRDGDYRALQAPGGLGGRGVDRDVPDRCLGTPGRGYYRGAVGHEGQSLDHQRAEQEGLPAHRSLAAPTDRRRHGTVLRKR